jgi:hypothetical protein
MEVGGNFCLKMKMCLPENCFEPVKNLDSPIYEIFKFFITKNVTMKATGSNWQYLFYY